MYICNIYIHIHLYYITFTNIFFFKNTHFLPPAFLQKLVTNITYAWQDHCPIWIAQAPI